MLNFLLYTVKNCLATWIFSMVIAFDSTSFAGRGKELQLLGTLIARCGISDTRNAFGYYMIYINIVTIQILLLRGHIEHTCSLRGVIVKSTCFQKRVSQNANFTTRVISRT